MAYGLLTEKVMGCVYRVYNKMRLGESKIDVKRKIRDLN